MRNGDPRLPAVDPLTIEQRRRLECMTSVRALWEKGSYNNPDRGVLTDNSIIRLTEYLYSGQDVLRA